MACNKLLRRGYFDGAHSVVGRVASSQQYIYIVSVRSYYNYHNVAAVRYTFRGFKFNKTLTKLRVCAALFDSATLSLYNVKSALAVGIDDCHDRVSFVQHSACWWSTVLLHTGGSRALSVVTSSPARRDDVMV